LTISYLKERGSFFLTKLLFPNYNYFFVKDAILPEKNENCQLREPKLAPIP